MHGMLDSNKWKGEPGNVSNVRHEEKWGIKMIAFICLICIYVCFELEQLDWWW